MAHPLVAQLRFTRREFKRALEGVTDAEACLRFMPMNCIAWNVGHLAWQEQRYFLYYGQGLLPLPDIQERFAYGAPGSTPSLEEMLSAWRTVTQAADPWLDTLTSEKLLQNAIRHGKPRPFTFGSLVQRTIYHYWYHTGENMAIRQMLLALPAPVVEPLVLAPQVRARPPSEQAQVDGEPVGHAGLPEFVGDIDGEAPYRPE